MVSTIEDDTRPRAWPNMEPPVPLGVSIHPSVYLLLDTNKRISSSSETWSFHQQLSAVRTSVISDESQVWWKSSVVSEDEIDPQTKFRILVCGDAGVGKSTLINILLGVPNLVSLVHEHRDALIVLIDTRIPNRTRRTRH